MTTERELLDLLHYRYSQGNPGNGPRYVVAEHVRSSAGFYARRCLDAMVQDLWPSSGLALHGFELKCSRSDWLRELADPSKAAKFERYVNHFWLVIADRSMVKLDEVPSTWGILAPTDDGSLRAVRVAPPLIPEPLPVSLRAALLRATAKTAASRAQVDWLTAERDSARSALTEPAPPKLCAHESVTDYGSIGEGLLTTRCDDCWLAWPFGSPVPAPS